MDRGVGAAVRPLSEIDRKDLAIQALAGSETVSDLAARHGMSRKFVYQQTQAWFRICLFRVTQACRKRRPVRAGLRPEGCPMREAARLPVVKPAGAEAIPGPAG